MIGCEGRALLRLTHLSSSPGTASRFAVRCVSFQFFRARGVFHDVQSGSLDAKSKLYGTIGTWNSRKPLAVQSRD